MTPADRLEARVQCRLAWNNWPDNENSRRQIADSERRDPLSAAAWDRVIDALLCAMKSAPELDATRNIGEREPAVTTAYSGADTDPAVTNGVRGSGHDKKA